MAGSRAYLHQRLGRAGQAGRDAVAVHQRVLGVRAQRVYGARHAGHRGVQDVEAVDLGGADEFQVPGQRPLADQRRQRLAARFAERLGIAQAFDGAARVQDHRGHGHRPGQRAAAGFVHAADAPRDHRPASRSAMASAALADAPRRSLAWM